MKKTLLLAFAAILLFSCKKDHSASSGPAGKKYRVSFVVSNLSNKVTGFGSGRTLAVNASDTVTALNANVDVLYYRVYGSHVNAKSQDSTMNNFGTITDALPAGQYEIVFVAGKKGLQAGADQLATDGFGYPGIKWQDTFWDTFTLTVVNGNISRAVTLKRVVGKLELTILDNMPLSADSLIFTVNPEAATMGIDYAQSQGPPANQVTFAVAIPQNAKGHPNFTVDRLIGNTVIPFNVAITCKDANSHVLGTALASNVTVRANVRTILSGNLFSASPGTNSSQTFTVKADTAWQSQPVKTF